MVLIKRLLSTLSIFVAGVIALAVSFAIISNVTAALARTIFAPPTCCIDEGVVNRIATWAYGSPLKVDKGAESELSAGDMDSEQIRSWLEQCTAVGLSDPTIHRRVMAQFGKNGDHYANTPSNTATQDSVLAGASQIRFLSDTLIRSRVENARNVAAANKILQIGTWIAIFIGFATTVLVSLSSSEFGQGQSAISRTIRILAVVFPALGTAVAAVIAFYAPREDILKRWQVLGRYTLRWLLKSVRFHAHLEKAREKLLAS